MNRITLIFTLVFLLLTSACVPLTPESADSMSDGAMSEGTPSEESTNSQAEATIHRMEITATADGWEAPESVSAGWVEITLNNQSQGMRQAAFLRLDDDKTLDDVFAALQAGMEGTPEWMTGYGGPSGVMPGVSGTVAANLAAGQYIVIDPVPEADGIPGMAKGYFMPLVVEESENATMAPESTMSVELADYAFLLDQEALTAGSHSIHVTNSGPQEAHEIVIVKLNEGATVQDFLQAMGPDAPAGPPPGMPIAGTAAFDTITENVIHVELEEGATYGLVCFIPSTEHGGQPHFMLGMVGQFTVGG